jgi:hypothetical protein
MSLGQGVGPAPAIADLNAQKLRVEQLVKAGAGWFLWIGLLSVVNSVIGLAGGGVHFIVGLGVAQVVDVLAHHAGSSGIALDIIINGFVVGIFVVFWKFAGKGHSWAFIIGMLLYVADAVLLLMFKDIFSAAFHGYALFRIYNGMKELPILHQLEAALAPPDAPIVPR